MTAPLGVSTRTKRSPIHWALRAAVLGLVAGAVSLPFWARLASPLLRFEIVYWTSAAPLSPTKWALQGMAWRWVTSQPITFWAWLGAMATGAAVSLVVYLWETWASRPMDSSKSINCKEN